MDASFLRLETSSAHMHVGWLSLLELPPGREELDIELLRRRVEGRLRHVPRFRRRLREAPLGEPYLVDDDRFEIERHVTVARPKATHAQLQEIADEFLSRPLSRERPLWALTVVPRVGVRAAAIIGKVHHALVDGIAAVEFGTLIFDLDAEEAPVEAADWRPQEEPSPLRMAVDSVADSAVEQFRTAGRVAAMGLAPGRALRIADTMRRAAFSLAEEVGRPAPHSYLNPAIGPRRSLVTRSVPFSRLDRVKRTHGVKLNDVVLAVTAGALRRFAAALDEEAEPLRAMVPVNVRGERESGGAGNRIAFAFLELPVDEDDPLRRLELIRAQSERFKSDGRMAGSDALLQSVGLLPAPVKDRVARLAASPRTYNLTISNVPGPRFSLYAAGARVKSIYPVIPVSEGHAISIGVLSYEKHLHFAAYVDPVSLGRTADLPDLLSGAVAELEGAGAPS